MGGSIKIKFISFNATLEGIAELHSHHSEITFHLAAVDEKINDHGYNISGLRDASDRKYQGEKEKSASNIERDTNRGKCPVGYPKA